MSSEENQKEEQITTTPEKKVEKVKGPRKSGSRQETS